MVSGGASLASNDLRQIKIFDIFFVPEAKPIFSPPRLHFDLSTFSDVILMISDPNLEVLCS